jgi:hypothetical protein
VVFNRDSAYRDKKVVGVFVRFHCATSLESRTVGTRMLWFPE